MLGGDGGDGPSGFGHKGFITEGTDGVHGKRKERLTDSDNAKAIEIASNLQRFVRRAMSPEPGAKKRLQAMPGPAAIGPTLQETVDLRAREATSFHSWGLGGDRHRTVAARLHPDIYNLGRSWMPQIYGDYYEVAPSHSMMRPISMFTGYGSRDYDDRATAPTPPPNDDDD